MYARACQEVGKPGAWRGGRAGWRWGAGAAACKHLGCASAVRTVRTHLADDATPALVKGLCRKETDKVGPVVTSSAHVRCASRKWCRWVVEGKETSVTEPARQSEGLGASSLRRVHDDVPRVRACQQRGLDNLGRGADGAPPHLLHDLVVGARRTATDNKRVRELESVDLD